MSGQNTAEKFYSLQEVADILRVSERSVFRYIHGGRLRASKIGYWRISLTDLKTFLGKNANIYNSVANRQAKERESEIKKKKPSVKRNGPKR